MKSIIALLSFCFVFLSHADEEEFRMLSDFHSIFAKSKFQVTLIKSDSNAIKITTLSDYAFTSDIVTNVVNGRLEIYTTKKSFEDKDFHVTVYFKDVDRIHVKNDAEVLTEPNQVLTADFVELSCSIGGKINVEVNAPEVKVNIRQGGSILLKGETNKFDASIFTGGRISGSKLLAKDVLCHIKMGGDMIVNASESLDVKIFSGGTVKYKGDPSKITQDIKVGGTLKKIK